LFNIAGYYNQLIDFLNQAVVENFIRKEHRGMIIIDDKPRRLLEKMEDYQAPKINKSEWIKNISRR
jgi:predicted Rossmann-fold nucleotide-binding protein